jgi:ribose 5-phosphate isomerase B
MSSSTNESKKMTVAIGCDPNASALKEIIIAQLKSFGHEIKDFGSDDPIYARVAFSVGEAVAAGKYDRGILLCGTGIGMSIAANKVPGVYAALGTNTYSAERAIKSNNANVLTIGGWNPNGRQVLLLKLRSLPMLNMVKTIRNNISGKPYK